VPVVERVLSQLSYKMHPPASVEIKCVQVGYSSQEAAHSSIVHAEAEEHSCLILKSFEQLVELSAS